MTPEISPLRNLAFSSMLLNRWVWVLVGVALLLVGGVFWAGQLLLDKQKRDVEYYFFELTQELEESGLFLRSIAEQVTIPGEIIQPENTGLQKKLVLQDQNLSIHQGQGWSFATPFNVMYRAEVTSATDQSMFSLGRQLANFYSLFWSTSVFPSPQLFMISPQQGTTLAVPAIGSRRGHTTPLNLDTYLRTQEPLRDLKLEQIPRMRNEQVYWSGVRSLADSAPQILASMSIDLPRALLDADDAVRKVMFIAVINIEKNGLPTSVDMPVFKDVTVVSPIGQVLFGEQGDARAIPDGLSFVAQGIRIKISTNNSEPWSALYLVSYQSFLSYAQWPLLSLIVLLVVGILAGWAANRWYRLRVVRPAQRAHRRVIESEAFSRAVIDTAPTGLCVVRRSDHQVLVENRRAHEWQGTSRFIAGLSAQYYEDNIGEACVEVEGRALHVSFSSTRYQEEDVIVCAFSDLTQQRQTSAQLIHTSRLAQEASEAKTVFLATMSHEIRTPLYGVLGTLELLERTRLDPRQQGYLTTIQRSSATLLQLISDVLDVSKIESGQMALETTGFSPLGMLEEVLDAYVAAAVGKGLKIYAWVDPSVPDELNGDHVRIRQILGNFISNAIKFTEVGQVVVRLKVLEHASGHVTLQWQVADTGVGISQEQQVRLFEPFYQAVHGHIAGGTGLGLSICWRLSQLMKGQIRVVSEPGLGSSFNFILDLPLPEPSVATAKPLVLRHDPVFVRAPIPELVENTRDWLVRWGANALVVPHGLLKVPQGAVLVDLLPEEGSGLDWQGPRVVGTRHGSREPEPLDNGWSVGAHMMQAIGQAVMFAQSGQSSNIPASDGRTRLDLRVLVAEDNPINQFVLQEQLEELGCVVVMASNGQEALSLWQPEAFDVVVTDVNMPIMNGYELARAIRQQDPDVPIIGVTANAMREEGERCITVGMNARVVKPMTLQVLWTELARLCHLDQAAVQVAVDRADVSSPQTTEDTMVVSAKMREVFIKSMTDDLHRVRHALAQQDADQLISSLHRVRGALAVVQAPRLADVCGEIEEGIEGQALDLAWVHKTELLLTRIDQAVALV
ncbi:response regulator [Pseudomonas sp. NPDC087697]|uniref:hybrid sensor histidine kinase/response regulator n=1 Tax=Pseudomonas sp. NPDC087697 TaxID=3364447 RepID=UPI00382ECF46